MHTYDYKLVTDRYTAQGQVDAESEQAADKLIRQQVATPRHQGFNTEEFVPPKVESIKLTLKHDAPVQS